MIELRAHKVCDRCHETAHQTWKVIFCADTTDYVKGEKFDLEKSFFNKAFVADVCTKCRDKIGGELGECPF